MSLCEGKLQLSAPPGITSRSRGLVSQTSSLSAVMEYQSTLRPRSFYRCEVRRLAFSGDRLTHLWSCTRTHRNAEYTGVSIVLSETRGKTQRPSLDVKVALPALSDGVLPAVAYYDSCTRGRTRQRGLHLCGSFSGLE